MKNLFLISILLTGIFFACKTPRNAGAGASTNIVSITHGTSYGMCRGYCKKEEVITPTGLSIIDKSWDSTRFPKKQILNKFSTDEFIKLANMLDMDAWEKLEERIGCPDCTDAGSEYITIVTKKGTKTVTFDAHKDVPEIQEFLTEVRKYRKAHDQAVQEEEMNKPKFEKKTEDR